MGQKRYTPEQIIGKLRQAEVRSAEGARVAENVRELGVTQQTYYRWRKEYGGLKVSQAKHLKELERENARQRLGASERRACRVLGQVRSTQRRQARRRLDEEVLRSDVVKLASRYGRYGYRRVTALLRAEGWPVNHKRVERIWRQEGLKVPRRQPKRGRLWPKTDRA
jgi:hypothetical protein